MQALDTGITGLRKNLGMGDFGQVLAQGKEENIKTTLSQVTTNFAQLTTEMKSDL